MRFIFTLDIDPVATWDGLSLMWRARGKHHKKLLKLTTYSFALCRWNERDAKRDLMRIVSADMQELLHVMNQEIEEAIIDGITASSITEGGD